MPRMQRFRKPATTARKAAVRRPRYYRRKAKTSTKKGGMFFVRKAAPIHTSNNLGVIGSYAVQEAGTGLTLGTPIAQLGATGIYDVPFSIQFSLDQIQSSVEITNLFDKYRIVSCKIKVQSTLSTATQATTPAPYIDYIQDHDDASVPSLAAMREKMGVKTKYFNATRPNVVMGVRPLPAMEIYNGVLASGYGVPRRSPFINSSTVTVPHYGIKGVIRNLYLPAQVNSSFLTWDVTYGVAVRDVQ